MSFVPTLDTLVMCVVMIKKWPVHNNSLLSWLEGGVGLALFIVIFTNYCTECILYIYTVYYSVSFTHTSSRESLGVDCLTQRPSSALGQTVLVLETKPETWELESVTLKFLHPPF